MAARISGRGLAASAVLLLAQAGPARYRAGQLACAVFAETIQTAVQGQSGTATVGDKLRRTGTVVVRARASGDSLLVEAWYDSLAVLRQTAAGRETAETDGFVGGRYRGVLLPDGRFETQKAPFVPDDLAGQVDLASALDEFFPRLPTTELTVGRDWTDGNGFTIHRDRDSRDRAGPVAHYTWTDTRRAGQTLDAGDSLAVRLDQAIKERGDLAWSDRFGPLSWTRHLVINARIPATGGVKRIVRSTVEQDITVIRRFDLDSACGPASGDY